MLSDLEMRMGTGVGLLGFPGAQIFRRAADNACIVVATQKTLGSNPFSKRQRPRRVTGYLVGAGDSVEQAALTTIARIPVRDAPAGPIEAADKGFAIYDARRGRGMDPDAPVVRVCWAEGSEGWT